MFVVKTLKTVLILQRIENLIVNVRCRSFNNNSEFTVIATFIW